MAETTRPCPQVGHRLGEVCGTVQCGYCQGPVSTHLTGHIPGAVTPRCATGAKGYYLEDKITVADLWLSYFKVEHDGSVHRLYIMLKLCRIRQPGLVINSSSSVCLMYCPYC